MRVAGVVAVAAATLLMSPATQAPPPKGQELPLFTISKSENKNQVQYAMTVDDRCSPVSNAPVHAYWLMNEWGPGRTAPLLAREQPAYGALDQKVLERQSTQGKVSLALRAMPSRTILVETSLAVGGACQVWSTATVDGAPAHLYNVHVKLRWPIGVDYILLQGWSLDGKRLVTERLKG